MTTSETQRPDEDMPPADNGEQSDADLVVSDSDVERVMCVDSSVRDPGLRVYYEGRDVCGPSVRE